MKRYVPFLFAACALVAYAADISGEWKGTADFGGNTVERTFSFKVDGKKLTGSTTSQLLGKSEIKDGVVDGNSISFTIVGSYQGNEMTLQYKGKVSGDQIELSSDVNGQTIEWKLKRAS